MIHEVGVELRAQIAARGCPFPVIDGPEIRKTTTFARERIVIEHDPGGDSFGSTHMPGKNPRTLLTRSIGVKITIFSKSPRPNSTYWEHKRRAEQVLDFVLVGLYKVAKKRQNAQPNFKSGKFFFPEDLDESETPGGAAYELLLTFDRGVADRNWDGSADAEVVISPQMVGGPALTFAVAGHTITRSFGSWLGDKFAIGQTVIVGGTSHNNGTHGPISILTDTVMTFASGLTNETATAATLTGNGVVLNSTTQATGPEGSETACGNGGT